MPLWGGFRMGVERSDPYVPAVGDGETAALQILHGQVSPACFFRQGSEFQFQLRKRFPVAVPQHGDDETLIRADGYGDVIVQVFHDVRTVYSGVDLGHFLQCFDYGLDKEAHETEFGSVPFPVRCIELFAELHHGGHVAFVEGSQDGRLVLGLYQPCRDGTAQRAHGFSDEARRSLLFCFPFFPEVV